jgi:sarcosine oxidase subunit beta
VTESGAEILVIGAGVVGSTVAKAAADRGRSVLVVDANGGPGHGSTSSSAAIVRLHATSVDAVVLAAEALPYWQKWRDFLDAPQSEALARLHRCGSVILDDGTRFAADAAAAMSEVGVSYEWWDHDEVREQLPDFDLRAFGPPRLPSDTRFWDEPEGVISRAVFTPDSGWVDDPALAAANLMAAAQRAGARLRARSMVTQVVVRSGRVGGVILADGTELGADVVVNAAGPHSKVINSLAGAEADMSVHTAALRQELHHVELAPEIAATAGRVHVVDGDLGINFRPESGGAILVGSGGAACDVPVYVDPDDWDHTIRTAEWERHVLRLARRIPRLGVPRRRRGVTGLYDVTPDWLPIYDRTSIEGFYVAIGTSGNQFKTAPLVGELMVELIDRDTSMPTWAADLELPGPVTGHPIRMATYSSTRTVAMEGSRG